MEVNDGPVARSAISRRTASAFSASDNGSEAIIANAAENEPVLIGSDSDFSLDRRACSKPTLSPLCRVHFPASWCNQNCQSLQPLVAFSCEARALRSQCKGREFKSVFIRMIRVWTLLFLGSLTSAGLAQEVTFSRKIRPLLQARCGKCHGAEKHERDVNFSVIGGRR